MSTILKRVIFFGLLALLSLVVLLNVVFRSRFNPAIPITELIFAGKTVEQIYIDGAFYSGAKFASSKCLKESIEDSRNNIPFLSCLLNDKHLNLFGNINISARINFITHEFLNYSIIDNISKRSVEFSLSKNENLIFLPQRRYRSSQKRYFDTFGQNIFIDRYLVNKNEILKSSRELGDNFNIIKFAQNYCFSRSSFLLFDEFFDAATFYPVSIKRKRPKVIINSPYPWGIGELHHDLYKVRSGIRKFKKSDCQFLISKECRDEVDYLEVPTWMGIYETLGGDIELFSSVGDFSLSLSSSFLPMKSSWHQLGKRVSWNGDFRELINSLDDQTHMLLESAKQSDLSFRCMRFE